MNSAKRLGRLPDGNRSVAQQVAGVVRRLVVSGELAPGNRLGQDWLCEELGVSPAPVREALRHLEAEGLVEHRPNRGVFVLALSEDELMQVVAPTRLLLERYAINLVLASRKSEFVARLTEALEEMEKALREGDLEGVNEADVRFHEVAIILCGQPHTMQLWRSITPRLRAWISRLAPRMAAPSAILEEHAELLAVIRAGDTEEIERALHAHSIEEISRLLHKQESSVEVATASE